MCSWDRLPPIAQRLILAASAANGITITSATPPSIHRFPNARNATALQADCALTYSGNKILHPTDFYQALLQSHILVIPDPNAPTGMYPLLPTFLSAGLANTQQISMRVQILLAMG